MFRLFRLAMQVFLKPYSLGDKTSCKKFLENILALVKPLAASNKMEIDDTIIRHLEHILKTDALFDYFYNMILGHLSTEEIVFESADASEIVELVESSSSDDGMPEAINPLVIVSLITQIIALINAIKNAKTE